ncbi:MAG: excinuclease ABC subunit UvrB [Oscillospiraceae bacterium]|jgi:excinuclease ABC subunit B|nr:excinuclease ABC subunit UvrB [Oscillospiraceae bacterium]
MNFKIESKFEFHGDQKKAVDLLSAGIEQNLKEQVLLGVTGSGKTFTMAGVIEKINKPTLVLAHNKTLAAQLCSEFKSFFPNNAVEFFVSYYDYYRPEAYIASSDTYIEKDSAINEEIDKLRHSATSSLAERNDVIVVASVSCIYNLGNPYDYKSMTVSLRPEMVKDRDELINKLISIQYKRNDIAFERGNFRVRGNVIDIFPVESFDRCIRSEFNDNIIQCVSEINPISGVKNKILKHAAIYPASHYIVPREKIRQSMLKIENEMLERIKYFQDLGKVVEAQRIEQRTRYDMEMLEEIGFCKGIENYSRILSGGKLGSPPFTLFDFFPKDFLLLIDESHVTLPQIRAMYSGDRMRKINLIDYGFRLPSALDNRPLKYDEFYEKINKVIFVSATPGDFELQVSSQKAEQIIRPTGLVDPKIFINPISGQMDDLFVRINKKIAVKQRVLITTLTKKMAEDLTSFLENKNFKIAYMHSDVDTYERMKIIKRLRLGEIDILVGVNLLREGLDIPEVSLVAILDADKEGFLRTHRSLIQTIGRAARNSDGEVVMYADTITGSMKKAIDETNRRRKIQLKYNEEHGIIPKTVVKDIAEILEISSESSENIEEKEEKVDVNKMTKTEREKMIRKLKKEMKQAAKSLEFEKAAALRDKIGEFYSKTT